MLKCTKDEILMHLMHFPFSLFISFGAVCILFIYFSAHSITSFIEGFNVLTPRFSVSFYMAQMIEGVQPFHPKPPEEVVKLMCCEGKRPPLKIKARSYPPDLKE